MKKLLCPPGCALIIAVLSLAACGGASSPPSGSPEESPSAPGSPTPAVVVSATPPPTYSYTPGAKPIPAATFPAQAGSTDVGEASTGWWFEPQTDIQVTHLGYYDDGGDGLLHEHPAGIYDDRRRGCSPTPWCGGPVRWSRRSAG